MTIGEATRSSLEWNRTIPPDVLREFTRSRAARMSAVGWDHRAVPLEVLHEFTRSIVEMTSIRRVAEDSGTNRSSVHKFITVGTTPHPRIRRLLGLWYLRRLNGGLDDVDLIRPYASALDVLLADVPAPHVVSVALDVLSAIRQGVSAGGEEAPRWIDAMVERRAGGHIANEAATTTAQALNAAKGGVDHRAIPLEAVREFARSEVERTSYQLVADDAGIGRSTIHKFICKGTIPQPRVRRLLALWYLRRLHGVDELELIRPYASALDILLADVPGPRLPGVTLDVLTAIRKGIAAGGNDDPPPWLNAIRRRRVGWLLGDT